VTQRISAASQSIVFNQGQIAGNIWMTEIRGRD
jgi:hypothetical protein